jgi:hypothetical protein
MPLKAAGTNRVGNKRQSAERDAADESRREAWAGRMSTLILAVVVLFFFVTCLHMFTNKF